MYTLYGVNGKNFIKTMLNVGKKYDTVRVVCDQIGTPTYTYDLARLLVDMAESEKYGLSKATRTFNSRLDKNKLTESGFDVYKASHSMNSFLLF